jgi:hypothetical protein
VPPPVIRLRSASPGLLGLPWELHLSRWDVTEVPLRDLPVGPSRHLVRFVEVDGRLFALKDLPIRIAHKEYAVLRDLEGRGLPAVRAVGLVEHRDQDAAVLVTHYLDRSWQYRRLLMRIPLEQRKPRERLLDAMAGLLVDLHRNGVFWGDCSLANTLFKRDGQVLQAHLVDAETSELHPSLSTGQRELDLDLCVENVAGGLLDLATRLEQPGDMLAELFESAESVRSRYTALWEALFEPETLGFDERSRVAARIRRLNELGFAVDEVHLAPVNDGSEVRLEVKVAGHSFHANQLYELTGLRVGEGQARILLNHLRAYQARLEREKPGSGPDTLIGDLFLDEVFRPGLYKAAEAAGPDVDPVQAYCDLLEIRWLLSEEAGRDIGDEAALSALRERRAPRDSAASMSVVETATAALPLLTQEMLAGFDPSVSPAGPGGSSEDWGG